MFQNLTIKEVDDARKTASEGHFVINVSGSLSVCLSLSLFPYGFIKNKKKTLMLLLAVSADISPQDQSGLWRCAAGPGPGGVWVAGRIPFSPVHLGGGQGCQIFILYIKDQLLQKPKSIFSGSVGEHGVSRHTHVYRCEDRHCHPCKHSCPCSFFVSF